MVEWGFPGLPSGIKLLKKGNIKAVKSFFNNQTCKSNDQCILWYSFMKFLLFSYTGLYKL